MPADLNRSNDTPIATLKLMEIPVVDWHRFPTAIPAANVARAYSYPVTFTGGAYGDATLSTANATDAYSPKNLTDHKAFPGAPNSVVPSESVTGGQALTSIADYTSSTPITAPEGYIGPHDPYSKAVPAAPTITSLAPNTAVAGSQSPLSVVVTGTGFTQWTTLETGNVFTPYASYVSATKMSLLMDPARSSAGIVVVKAVDHGVKSAGTNFTYT